MHLGKTLRALTALFGSVLGTTVGAATLSWSAGTGALTGANYTDTTSLTTGVAPATGDTLYIGNAGVATYSTSTFSPARLEVGHSLSTNPGDGTVKLSGGTVSVTGGSGTVTDSSIYIGLGNNGTIAVNGGTLLSAFGIVVGSGNDLTKSAVLSVASGANLRMTGAGTLLLGTGGTGEAGIPGTMSVAGNGTLNGDFVIGDVAASSYTQTAGSITFTGLTYVGRSTSGSSTANFSGGTFTSNQMFVGDGGTTQANYVNISGNAFVRTPVASSGHNFTIGVGSMATGTTFNISGNATVSSGNRFLMGGSQANKDPAYNSTVNQSGGTLTTNTDVRVGDAGGYSTYNLNDGTIVTKTGILVSRQGFGVMVQKGGTAIAIGSGLRIGDSETRNSGTGIGTILTNSGTYTISGGTMSASSVSVGANGSGTFEVVGDGGTINVSGTFSTRSVVGTPPNSSTGTLKFTLDPNESLSTINVVGAATLGSATYVQIDDLGTPPEAGATYTLLSAASIVDTGVNYVMPSADWYHEIKPGGNGQVLAAYYLPEPSSIAFFGLAAMALTRRRLRQVA